MTQRTDEYDVYAAIGAGMDRLGARLAICGYDNKLIEAIHHVACDCHFMSVNHLWPEERHRQEDEPE